MQRWQPPPNPSYPTPPPPINWQPPTHAGQTQYNQGYQQMQLQYASYAGAYNQQAMGALAGNSYPNQQQLWGNNAAHVNQQQIYGQQPNQGYVANFNQPNNGFAFNHQGQQQQQQLQRPPQQQAQAQTGGRANLTNLRAQLMSTLQNQRKGN
jgi:hypothetical protein